MRFRRFGHQHDLELIDKTVFTSAFEDALGKGDGLKLDIGLDFYTKVLILTFKCKTAECGAVVIEKRTNR